MLSNGIHLRTTWQEMATISILDMYVKVTNQNLQAHPPPRD